MIRVVLIEDDLDFCYLINNTIKQADDIMLLAIYNNAKDVLENISSLDFDIVLGDLSLTQNNFDGIEVIKQVRLLTNCKAIILSSFENPEIVIDASTKSFSSAYIFKSQFNILLETIRSCYYGHNPQEHLIQNTILQKLSNAELSVFKMILNQEVQLLSSNKTIANQKTSILKKLDLKNQKELQHLFKNYGL
ncbi:DNA-binding response regulator [Thomasclavelia sp.]